MNQKSNSLAKSDRAARVSKRAAGWPIRMLSLPVPARSLAIAALLGIPEPLSFFTNNPD